MTEKDFYIKSNFIKFVKRFERENGSIVEFGSGLNFDQKIDIIYKTFESYYEQDRKQNSGESVTQDGSPETDREISED